MKAGAAPPFPFFPHAGVLGRDLFLNNFTDQDDRPELVRDWDCSDYTYDGHRGHDSLIRTFREQAIGVPVFAALPGEVLGVHDGEPDRNTAAVLGARANYVLLGHENGYTTWYLHLRRDSVAVAVGQHVAAGTQLGLTGSSGFSTWPHLHFETSKDGQWLEPSAGPCRGGDSLWVDQSVVLRDFYVADLYLSRHPIEVPDVETFLADEGERAGSFVTGRQTIAVRADLRNLPAGATYRLSVRNPRGRVVYERSSAYDDPAVEHLSLAVFALELDLDKVGTWRLRAEIGGLAVEAPFRVVANSRQLGNRRPNRITARMSPAQAVPGEVLTCAVQTSLITEDPDYDLVSYGYEWRVNNRVVRTVTSAATTDLLAADVA
ncbi:MAG TPA: peptidoglycan DD-metalloendopeptidase family protein, partial [Thermoanaerobaculia bacterium]|nr:peptidoglycan DD-metalloendopeptidase family protein [Thermoanaerobaculia bacterium]